MSHYKQYEVALRFQFPAWDEQDGIPFRIVATTKAEAVLEARRQAQHDGHIPCRGKGKYRFKATVDPE